MKQPTTYTFILLVGAVVARYTCTATTCVSPFIAFPKLNTNEPWNSRIPHPAYSSGNFTRPALANRSISDVSNKNFSLNERILIGDNYTVKWRQNATKNVTWDLYLVNAQYERYFLHSLRATASVSNISMGGYLWHVQENAFVHVGEMYFFYVTRKDGFWAEGFASRFVNITRPEERNVAALMAVSNVGSNARQFSGVLLLALSLLVSFGFVFIF